MFYEDYGDGTLHPVGGGGGGSDGSGCGCLMFVIVFAAVLMNGTADVKTAFICAAVVGVIISVLTGNR